MSRKFFCLSVLPTHLFLKILLPKFYSVEMTSEMTNSKPKVIVFDLDYTLWPFWVDTHVTPPFRKTTNGSIVDMSGSPIKHYPEVPEVLQNLKTQGYILAVASRTGEVEGAKQLLDLFGWRNKFSNLQIYPGMKTKHLQHIKDAFDVEYNDIIFFDDEGRNIRDVSELGVLSIMVRNGVTRKIVDDALDRYAREKS